MPKIDNIGKFYAPSVKGWKRKDFVKHFEPRFPNAGEIYDALNSEKKEKKSSK